MNTEVRRAPFRGFHLFTLFGFEVKLDLSWLLLALLISWSLGAGWFPVRYPELASHTYAWMGVAVAVGVFFSIVFHEFSHSIVARYYGMPIRGITLFIFGGVAEMESEPPDPKAEFLMAIAGPSSRWTGGGCSEPPCGTGGATFTKRRSYPAGSAGDSAPH
jgi:Zn-dependent protease